MVPWPSTIVILSARLIWLISWATRWAMGAREVTHGQAVLAVARFAFSEAWLAAAVAGTASSPASTAAASNRPFLYL